MRRITICGSFALTKHQKYNSILSREATGISVFMNVMIRELEASDFFPLCKRTLAPSAYEVLYLSPTFHFDLDWASL